MEAKVTDTHGRHFLWEWHLAGMERVWGGYREVTEAKEVRKKQKLFLNFLERNAKRNPPSLARYYSKRAEKIVGDAFLEKTLQGASAEEEAAFARFQGRKSWSQLKRDPLYRLLLKASRFLKPEGLATMRGLILGLRVENGQLVYPRYEELRGVLGDQILKKWELEYEAELKDLAELDEESGKQALKDQVLEQLAEHTETISREHVSDDIQDLPEKVAQWQQRYAASSEVEGAFVDEARALYSIFNSNEDSIRFSFGNLFASIRTDLKNFITGLQKGVRIAKKSERVVFSGRLYKMGQVGSNPVETCQTLERASVNLLGQPINKIRHGQFKVANWEIDGIVYARRLIEITIDEQGREHLLVDRLYTAGGFGRVREFKQEIFDYAAFLGIDPFRVHFNDLNRAGSPSPLNTKDPIYRDSWHTVGPTLAEAREIQHQLRVGGDPVPIASMRSPFAGKRI